ncbi:MAG TPA: hypothetical protein DCG47_13725 [Spirochaetaceae bacterium]|nr:hypothetical protein [Spirochaetaceae bacterium]
MANKALACLPAHFHAALGELAYARQVLAACLMHDDAAAAGHVADDAVPHAGLAAAGEAHH